MPGDFSWVGGCGPSNKSAPLANVITRKMLLRHSWYRRQVRRFGDPFQLRDLAAWEEEKRHETMR